MNILLAPDTVFRSCLLPDTNTNCNFFLNVKKQVKVKDEVTHENHQPRIVRAALTHWIRIGSTYECAVVCSTSRSIDRSIDPEAGPFLLQLTPHI